MSTMRWVVVSSLGLGAALSCAEAEDQKADFDEAPDDGGSSGRGGSSAGTSTLGGKTSIAGSSAQGGKAGMGGAGGKTGSGGSTGNHAGTATEGGRAGSTSNEGGETGSGGSNTAGSNTGGSGSTALGCVIEAVGGMPSSAEGGAGGVAAAGEASGGAADMVGGGAAGADAGPLTLFVDDFELGNADKWAPAGGTWAVIDDGSKAYEQSLLENKLQVAIASDVCVADQIIEARVKVTEFKGQSNSYVAALFGRALSPSTHYLLALGSDKKLILRKRINSTSTSATSIGSAAAFTTTPDQWYDVRFELIGTSLKGCVGDVCVTGSDSAIASGSVGVGTVNTTAEFDDVRIMQP
jgi:hypothetical protein